MKLKTLLTYALAVAVLLFNDLHAASASVVNMHLAEAAKTTARIRITEGIRIILPTQAPLPAGFEWQITSNDPRVLRLTSAPKPVTSGEKTAKGEGTVAVPESAWGVSFVALRPGRSIVRLVFIRASNSGEEIASDTREIVVTVHADMK